MWRFPSAIFTQNSVNLAKFWERLRPWRALSHRPRLCLSSLCFKQSFGESAQQSFVEIGVWVAGASKEQAWEEGLERALLCWST